MIPDLSEDIRRGRLRHTQISPKKENLREMKKWMQETARQTFGTGERTVNQNLRTGGRKSEDRKCEQEHGVVDHG